MDSMAVYNFEAAIEMLEEDIALKTKRKKPTEEQENLLTLAHRNLGKLMATERITIIDSIIVDKQNVLSHIHLSNESGNLQTMRQLLNKPDTMDCMMFRNQLDNQAIFAQQDANGKLTLYKSELIGKEWTKPTPLKGIADEDTEASYNYPFMLTDGATLYYAATDEEANDSQDVEVTELQVHRVLERLMRNDHGQHHQHEEQVVTSEAELRKSVTNQATDKHLNHSTAKGQDEGLTLDGISKVTQYFFYVVHCAVSCRFRTK